jgi:raffinose/stachyose/melibiose transport system substrate-binding protein
LKGLALGSGMIAAAVFVQACAGPPAASTPVPTTAPSPATPTPVPAAASPTAAANVSFEAWTQYTPGNEPGRYAAFTQIVSDFNAQHPNITVKHAYVDAGEWKKSVQLAMESKKAGSTITADVGSASLIPWYYNGYLIVLDQYAKQFGWVEKDKGGAIASANLGTRASKVYNGAEIAGLPMTYQPLGVFYNKDLFTQMSVTPPKDWNGFTEAFTASAKIGLRPMAFGNSGQFHGLHVLSSLLAANVNLDRMMKWWTGSDTSVKFTDPDFLWAAQTAQDWAKANDFTPQFNAVNFNDAMGLFLAGKHPMFLTGDWNVAAMNQKTTIPIGFFPFPSHDTSFPWTIVKTPDWPFTITSWAPYRDQTAQFLDFQIQAHSQDIQFELGQVQPIFDFDTTQVKGSPLQLDVTAGIANKQTGFYIDTVDPQVHSLMWPSSQLLFDGSLAPATWAQQIHDAHAKYLTTAPH